VRVVEVGDRIAVGACASVLAALGAEVVVIEHDQESRNHKWIDRALVAAGKQVVGAALTEDRVQTLLADADIVLMSSDVTPMPYARQPRQIACDITATAAAVRLPALRMRTP
jgi:crotonobetainyl-CoA:carnitine CoA-transferase CaiB-like acyl-CoA transferase